MVFKLNIKQITLKELVLEIKEIITGKHNIDIEKYAEELANRSGLDLHDIKNLYNLMFEIYNSEIDIESKRRVWLKCEDNFIVGYANMYKYGKIKEQGKPMRDVLDDLEDVLIARNGTAIAFRYYNTLSKKPNDKQQKNKTKVVKKSEPKKPKAVKQEEPKQPQQDDSNDLLNTVLEIVNNVEIAEVDVSVLFSGILTLTQKAVKNSNGRELSLLKAQLDDEKEDNRRLRIELNQLTKDLESLKEEVFNFNNMNGKDKLRNFQKFNNNVKYMVDKFGIVNK